MKKFEKYLSEEILKAQTRIIDRDALAKRAVRKHKSDLLKALKVARQELCDLNKALEIYRRFLFLNK